MLTALDQLSSVAVDVIAKSKGATITSLERLDPVLTQLAASGDDFTNAFHVFLTYPFVDEVVGRDPQVARNLHMGDYTNLSITLDIDVAGGASATPSLPTNLPTVINPTIIINDVLACIQSGSLTSEACKKVLANLQKLAPAARGVRQAREPRQGRLPRAQHDPRPAHAVAPGPDDGPAVADHPADDPAHDAPPDRPAAGRPRAAPGGPTGPTMAELMDRYDPALVSLLVPGMVQR